MAYTSTAGNGGPWYYWTTATVASTATTTAIWTNLVGNSTATTTIATSSDTCVYWVNANTTIQPPTPTPEQVARQRADAERWRKQTEEERQKREAAERRAQELLEANLVLEERERLRKDNHIFVNGRSGCRYRIRKGRTGNIDVVDDKGKITHSLCAHPAEAVPDYDTMLAQKIMLEDDDIGFSRIANRNTHYGNNDPIMPSLH